MLDVDTTPTCHGTIILPCTLPRQYNCYNFVQGAGLDSQDREHRTPLTLAASKQAWKTVKLLLSKGQC